MFCLSLMPQTKGKLTADIKDKKRESMQTITKTNKQKPHTNPRERQEERMGQRSCKTIKTDKQTGKSSSECLSINNWLKVRQVRLSNQRTEQTNRLRKTMIQQFAAYRRLALAAKRKVRSEGWEREKPRNGSQKRKENG